MSKPSDNPLPPGEYYARCVSVRKVKGKPSYTVKFEVELVTGLVIEIKGRFNV